jgi:hypothetical protein
VQCNRWRGPIRRWKNLSRPVSRSYSSGTLRARID